MTSPRLVRSSAWQHMAQHTPEDGLALPACPSCGHLFYPPQSYCPHCLHAPVVFQADSGLATVLSVCALHVSFDEALKAQLPMQTVQVRTDSGVCLFALADTALATGARVTVHLLADLYGGAAVFLVRPASEVLKGDAEDGHA